MATMPARIALFGIAFALTATFATGASTQFSPPPGGRPVTAKDISGRKFCWNSGTWIKYGADGSTTNYVGQHGKWSVPRPGIIKTARGERETEVLPDGQLHEHRKAYYGWDLDFWAKECD
jgi:hypothetical protein